MTEIVPAGVWVKPFNVATLGNGLAFDEARQALKPAEPVSVELASLLHDEHAIQSQSHLLARITAADNIRAQPAICEALRRYQAAPNAGRMALGGMRLRGDIWVTRQSAAASYVNPRGETVRTSLASLHYHGGYLRSGAFKVNLDASRPILTFEAAIDGSDPVQARVELLPGGRHGHTSYYGLDDDHLRRVNYRLGERDVYPERGLMRVVTRSVRSTKATTQSYDTVA